MLPLGSSMAPLPFPTLCFGQPGKASRIRHQLPSTGIQAGPCSAGRASTIAAGLRVWSLRKPHLSQVYHDNAAAPPIKTGCWS